MRRTKDAITDFAIAKGYDGDKPKTIARAVDALAGVAGGGSGGGGGDANILVVKFETEDYQTATADKTPQEIYAAFNSGKTVIGTLHYSGGTSSDTFGTFLIIPYTTGGEYDYASLPTFQVSIDDKLYMYAVAHFGDGDIIVKTQGYQLTKVD